LVSAKNKNKGKNDNWITIIKNSWKKNNAKKYSAREKKFIHQKADRKRRKLLFEC